MSDRTLFGFAPPAGSGFTPPAGSGVTPPASAGALSGDGTTGVRGIVPGQVRFGRPGSGGTPGGPPADWRIRVWTLLRTAWRRHRTRDCLLGLDPYLLKDIGVSYAEAEAEANKPFWVA